MSEAQFTEFAGFQLSPELRRCIVDCLGCYSTCLETVTYSLEVGGQHVEPVRIRLLLDCADICQTAAAFMLRNSDLHQRVCAVCAEVCEQCAESCAQLGSHPQMAAARPLVNRLPRPAGPVLVPCLLASGRGEHRPGLFPGLLRCSTGPALLQCLKGARSVTIIEQNS